MFKRKKNAGKYGFQRLATPDTKWRGYQKSIKADDEKQQAIRRMPGYFAVLVIAAILIHGGFHLLEKKLPDPSDTVVSLYPPDVDPIDHQGLQNLLAADTFRNLTENKVEISTGTGTYQLYTSIDPDLQQSILASLEKRHAHRIGIVAIEPDTGRVLSMVSYDREDPEHNTCLSADLPAASIFKIVTASAAMGSGGFEKQSRFTYNGGRYTLYRSQLSARENQYTNYVSLQRAFAESNNPVFGKLGKNELGKDVLEKYAYAYYFNRPIEFDLPVETSVLEINDTPYNWAEVASGFNRTTTISPLHAAMISASMVNGGRIIKPTLIDVAAREDRTVYRCRPEVLSRTVDPSKVGDLNKLMGATIRSGTARGQFANISSSRVLSRLDMGGKTGSLNHPTRHIRYDWFTGYARDPEGSGKIAIGVIVAHKDYIGKRAATYFREAVFQYFQNRIDTDRDI